MGRALEQAVVGVPQAGAFVASKQQRAGKENEDRHQPNAQQQPNCRSAQFQGPAPRPPIAFENCIERHIAQL